MLSMGRSSRAAQDWALGQAARRARHDEIIWPDEDIPGPSEAPETGHAAPQIDDLKRVLHERQPQPPLRAAE
jgi:multidrug efflux pump